ncbi:MAG: hypothetical protein JW708_01230 [Vallitaleaceae bacterium]|nr:hypothetical protein [Vallitaleaceae bacterium]
MLKISNTEHLTGVTISGTHDDLYEIYEAIEKVLGPKEETDMTSLRVLGVCYDLRLCFMGDREIELVENSYHEHLQKYHEAIHPTTNVHFKVNVLWLEVMFVTLALDDYVKKYRDDKFFNKLMKEAGVTEEQKKYYALTRFEDIALVNLFQEKVWSAFREACGDAAYKRLYKEAKEDGHYFVVITKYNDYCTQYLDTLEMKYIYAAPEKREKLLATLVKKITHLGEEYYQMYREISSYAIKNNLSKDQVRLADVEYPESIEW